MIKGEHQGEKYEDGGRKDKEGRKGTGRKNKKRRGRGGGNERGNDDLRLQVGVYECIGLIFYQPNICLLPLIEFLPSPSRVPPRCQKFAIKA